MESVKKLVGSELLIVDCRLSVPPCGAAAAIARGALGLTACAAAGAVHRTGRGSGAAASAASPLPWCRARVCAHAVRVRVIRDDAPRRGVDGGTDGGTDPTIFGKQASTTKGGSSTR